MGTLAIRIDDRLESGLERIARAKNRTKSDIAREMLRRELRLALFEEARRQVQPYAAAAGYLTDDDVFQDVS